MEMSSPWILDIAILNVRFMSLASKPRFQVLLIKADFEKYSRSGAGRVSGNSHSDPADGNLHFESIKHLSHASHPLFKKIFLLNHSGSMAALMLNGVGNVIV